MSSHADIAYFDCFSGISGDMILGALVDAGLDASLLQAEIAKLDLPDLEVTFEPAARRGIRATRALVRVGGGSPVAAAREHHLELAGAPAVPELSRTATLPRRREAVRHERHDDGQTARLEDLLNVLRRSQLSAEVQSTCELIFTRLAEAEAEVHGVDSRAVHLHEVGALDAVVDVVGAVAGLRLLGVDTVYASPLYCGTGIVDCAHGALPVPVPAVVALCREVPMVQTDIDAELVTPTGAAIITTLASGFGAVGEFVQHGVGYGAGCRDLASGPNVLRLRLGRASRAGHGRDEAVLIEANIDDMNPEVYGYLFDLLLGRGAKEVYITPVYMKKGRPGNVLSVLVDTAQVESMADIVLRETTTIGLRFQRVERRLLERTSATVTTPYGDVRVKISHLDGTRRNSPEYDDCARLARSRDVPILSVYEAALAAIGED